MGITYLNLSSFIHFSTIKDEKSAAKFHYIKTVSRGWPLPPEILTQSDLPPPDCSESWYVLPCSASTVRASEQSSIMANKKSYTGFPTSHQPRFYAARNFLTMGIKYLNLSSFIQVSTIKDEKSAARFHYIKTVSRKVVAQSIAFELYRYIGRGMTTSPWNLGWNWHTPSWGQRVLTHFAL